MDGDRELLGWDMGGADLRAHSDVPKSHRVGTRAEAKRSLIEDSVDWAGDRATISRDGGQREQAHAGQAVHHLLGAETPLRGVDTEQMLAGVGAAAIEKLSERFDISGRLVPSLEQIRFRPAITS